MNDVERKPLADEKPAKSPRISSLALVEVDHALAEVEKAIRASTDHIKARLAANAGLPPAVVKELAHASGQKRRLMMRRIGLLIESADPAAVELLEKLMKVKPAKVG